jgi:hypothetical protein
LLKAITRGTATWILETTAFNDWIIGEKPLLIISGGPGTGKSHLATKIIDYLRQKGKDEGRRGASVGYYYFSDGDKNTRTVLNALCAIVYQIATDDEIYRMHAAEACDRSPPYAMTTFETVWEDFLAAEYGPSSNGRLFLVFDGIDEADRNEFIRFLASLSESVLEHLKIQVLLVGRPEMSSIIKDKFFKSPFKTIEVSSSVNSEDIRKFSEARYDMYIKLPKKLKGLREKVITTLANKSDGMFLWVALTYEELKDISSPVQLRESLKSLPDSNLIGLYDRIFKRIESEAGQAKKLILLQELFCWTAHFSQPLSLYHLNSIIHFAVPNYFFDVEKVIEETCASLFVLKKTGEVLFDEISQREVLVNTVTGDTDVASTEAEAEDEDDAEDEGDDEDTINEVEQQLQNRQRGIYVHLRHASLGDYLKRSDLKPTAILLNVREGAVHVMLSSLDIICKGADAPRQLWLYLTSNFYNLLSSFDEVSVSQEDTKRIAEYLVYMFTSEPLGKYIAKPQNESYAGLPVVWNCFDLGGNNTDLQYPTRILIEKWFKRASNLTSVNLNAKASVWVKTVLENPLKLLVPLTETCIREWLVCKENSDEVVSRFEYAWRFITQVSICHGIEMWWMFFRVY